MPPVWVSPCVCVCAGGGKDVGAADGGGAARTPPAVHGHRCRVSVVWVVERLVQCVVGWAGAERGRVGCCQMCARCFRQRVSS